MKKVRSVCNKKNIVLIFDECTSGFRETYGGLYKKYGITPDIVMYGKSIGNGFPISVILGKKKIMNASSKTFISSTFWTENSGIAAAIKTLELMKKKKSWKIIKQKGSFVKKEILKLSKKHNLDVSITGLDALPKIEFKKDVNDDYCNFICYEMLNQIKLF